MYKTKRLISAIALVIATFLMVATAALPHHHHDDGMICLHLDMGHDDEAAHDHGHNGCNEDCAMNVDLIQDASQIGHASKAGLIPVITAIITWDNALLPIPNECDNISPTIYIEHPYKCIVSTLHGLRAPPSLA